MGLRFLMIIADIAQCLLVANAFGPSAIDELATLNLHAITTQHSQNGNVGVHTKNQQRMLRSMPNSIAVHFRS